MNIILELFRIQFISILHNEPLKRAILKYRNSLIVEAAGRDCILGIGLCENDPMIKTRTNWRGLNLLDKTTSMEIDDTVDVDESIVVNLNPTRLQRLCEHFRKRKLIWSIVLIILIVAIIVNPIVIVTMNKEKREKTSTTQITTVEIKKATVAHITTEKTVAAATAGKPEQITTTEKTTQIATETTTQIATETTATEEIIPPIIINENTTWQQSAVTVAGGNGKGLELNQLGQPWGIYVDEDSGDTYIADRWNSRIVRWKFGANTGELAAGGKSEIGNLNFPSDVILDKEKTSLIICDHDNKRVIRWFLQNSHDPKILISNISCLGLAMDNDGNLYISDYGKNQVIRWQEGDKEGTVVAGGNGRGNRLNQLLYPRFIFVDGNHSVYVTDSSNNRVMKWMENATAGTMIAHGIVTDKHPILLNQPRGVIVDHVGNIYISMAGNNQITRWSPGATEGVLVVGEKQSGRGPTQLNDPYDLSFDRQGNLYVLDSGNSRLQKFVIDRN
ncbi:unnamed protein product [Adineta steineri]|uniref:Uncharacterized protein n=2 Tax=Adineta steineri TaxID=433720 RepID=A0A819STS8_9BILA|nr:unnamed protein product [Adineta steineri]